MSVNPYIMIRSDDCILANEKDASMNTTEHICFLTVLMGNKIELGNFEEKLVFDSSYFYDLTRVSEDIVLKDNKSVILYAQVLGNTMTDNKSIRLVL